MSYKLSTKSKSLKVINKSIINLYYLLSIKVINLTYYQVSNIVYKVINKSKINLYYLLSIIIIIITYYQVSNIVDNEMILPKVKQIIDYLINLDLGVFIKNALNTIQKVIISYSLSLMIGLLLASLAIYHHFYNMINPYISILKTIPTISIIVIGLIWLGNEKSIYLIALLVIIPILYETFVHQLRNIDPNLIDVCNVYKFSFIKKVRYLYLYPLLEGLMLSLKQTFGLCFKIIVMAEVIGQAQRGIGAQIQNNKINLEMAGVFSWTIILIIIVLFIDIVLDFTAKKVIKWRNQDEN